MKPPLSLRAQLEALLFVAPGPVTTSQLATALDVSQNVLEKELEQFSEALNETGLRLQRFRGRVQMTTAPEAAEVIETFLGLETASRFTRASLETLAIVAYQQPITRPQIDAIRGVNSDSVLKGLLNKGLIQEVGRAEAPGRPILYSVTTEFLQYFGLNSLAELPPLDLDDLPPKPAENDTNGDQLSLLKTS